MYKNFKYLMLDLNDAQLSGTIVMGIVNNAKRHNLTFE